MEEKTSQVQMRSAKAALSTLSTKCGVQIPKNYEGITQVLNMDNTKDKSTPTAQFRIADWKEGGRQLVWQQNEGILGMARTSNCLCSFRMINFNYNLHQNSFCFNFNKQQVELIVIEFESNDIFRGTDHKQIEIENMGHSLFRREYPVEYGLDILSPRWSFLWFIDSEWKQNVNHRIIGI